MTPISYSTIVFDCDGVILNSNQIKTEAFRRAALPWGERAADALVAYHVAHGGVSRYTKFAYFLEHLLPLHAPGCQPGRDGPDLDAMLTNYARAVRAGLLTCDVAQGLEVLRELTPQSRWLIVSGGDQLELRDIFSRRDLSNFFDGGIFGSPMDKHTIVEQQLQSGNIQHPALFIGDSRLDHQVAMAFGIDFVFVNQWTEFSDWSMYCAHHGIPVIEAPVALVSLSNSAKEWPSEKPANIEIKKK